MGNDLRHDLAPTSKDPIDPFELARRDLKKALPKRFYSVVDTAPSDGGFVLRVDGKPVRTPSKAALIVPTEALARVLAEEWEAQREWIEPHTMPATRLVNSALDGVAHSLAATAAEVAKFAETDLVCYRAGDPQTLVAAQVAAWDPFLAFAREALGARFVCAEGVMYAAQPASALAAVREAVDAIASGEAGALRLAALSVMTSLTGSVLIALAIAKGAVGVAEAWTAAHVDEDYQMRLWGSDAEALARRETRWRDMQAAATVFTLSVP